MEKNQNENIKETFKRTRNYQIIISIPLLLSIIFMFLMSEKTDMVLQWGIPLDYLYVALIAITSVALIFSFFNWRCPNCKKYLGKAINPKYCSKCGAELR